MKLVLNFNIKHLKITKVDILNGICLDSLVYMRKLIISDNTSILDKIVFNSYW